MLVEDADRDRFLKSLKSMLKPEGRLLLLTMGDGTTERKTDTGEAFDLQERTHGESGRKMYLAATSYRGVNWEHHREELDRAGLVIEKMMDTENNEYGRCMTVYLARK
jgi:cyclopropane fatty-acyl-phospholipid synthase-like methyltransferase